MRLQPFCHNFDALHYENPLALTCSVPPARPGRGRMPGITLYAVTVI